MPKGVYTRKPTHQIAKGEKHYNWRGGMPKCVDCTVQLKKYKATRCNSCRAKMTAKESEGSDVGYSRVHKWLVQHFGKANRCENSECVRPSRCFEWSLLHGCRYEKKRDNFWMLCKRCHNIYDKVYETRRNKHSRVDTNQ